MLSRNDGRLVAVCIKATSRAEVVRVVTSQTPATFCIQVPMLDTTEAIQMALNMAYVNGVQSEAGASELGEAEVTVITECRKYTRRSKAATPRQLGTTFRNKRVSMWSYVGYAAAH
jgi:hypothetical protein